MKLFGYEISKVDERVDLYDHILLEHGKLQKEHKELLHRVRELEYKSTETHETLMTFLRGLASVGDDHGSN